MPSIEGGDVRLHYLEWGGVGAPPMVLLHGLEESACIWERFATGMSTEYRVIALDHRGHGDSQWALRGRYAPRDFVADVQRLVDELSLEGLVLVGHSEGGKHAVKYTARFPEKVAALVFVDGGLDTAERTAHLMLSGSAARSDDHGSLAQVIEHLRGLQPNSTAETLAAQARCLTTEIAGGRRVWTRDPALLDTYEWPDMWDDWRSLKCPTLIVRGRQSEVLGHEAAVRMREAISKVRLAELEGSTHWVHQELPGAFRATVRWFFDSPPQ